MKKETRLGILYGLLLGIPFLSAASVATGNIGMGIMIPIAAYLLVHALWAEKKIDKLREIERDLDDF